MSSWAALGCVGKTSLAMYLIAQRQRALGANLANVDTPGYVRRDIDFSQYVGGATASLETKLAQKLGPSPMFDYEQNV
jgi:flagellar basal-body rod protein FlgB